MGSIGVVAAMPQEIAPLLRRIATYRKESAGGFKLYRFAVAGAPVALIESGMGPRHAAAATAALIESCAPRVLVNFGFAGGVLPGLEIGDLVLAGRICFLQDGRLSQLPLPDRQLSDKVAQRLSAASLAPKRGSYITAGVITDKALVAGLVGEELENPVLEMETAALMRVAAEAGIPVLALRGISDAADEELGFSLEEFCDSELRIRPLRVLRTVARKPWIIPQLIRLSGNTKRAGEMLARGVELALEVVAEHPAVHPPSSPCPSP